MPTRFVPFGEFRPDAGMFRNGSGDTVGIASLSGLTPAYGDWLVAPKIQNATSQIGGGGAPITYGHHVHPSATGMYSFAGTTVKLWEYGSSLTDVTRAAGPYNTPDTTSGWQGTTFGDTVIMTNYVDDPQVQLTRGAAFDKLASSVFDPKARFAFPIRNNLFLAHCNLAAIYDGLAAGAHPTLVAWSQSDAPRFYGSLRTDPQYVGSGYQEIGNDYGAIVGGIGGDFGIVFQRLGATRIDGPPYQFRDLPGVICRFPNSVVRVGDDIYYWGPSGPTILAGGEGFPETLGHERVERSLTRLGDLLWNNPAPIHIGGWHDAVTGTVCWSYTTSARSSSLVECDGVLTFNYRDDDFGFFRPAVTGFKQGFVFPRTATYLDGGFLSSRGIERRDISGSAVDKIAQLTVDSTSPSLQPSLATIQLPFLQLDANMVTRILRVRPIIRANFSNAGDYSEAVTIRSARSGFYLNAVGFDNTYGPFSGRDASGWIAAPGTVNDVFHAIKLDLSVSKNGVAVAALLDEFEGVEIDYVTGGSRVA